MIVCSCNVLSDQELMPPVSFGMPPFFSLGDLLQDEWNSLSPGLLKRI
jgi:hypothetical protein